MRQVMFMQNDNSLISFSLISTSWELYHKDTFDMLKPFILYYIKDKCIKPLEFISIPATKTYLTEEFGIEIYNNVLELVFSRLKQDKYVILNRKAHAYQLTDKEIDISDFKTQRDNYKIKQKFVVDAFSDFLKNKNIQFARKVATDSLVSYLCTYGKNVILGQPSNITDGSVWNSRVGEFVDWSFKNESDIFEYMQDIVKGGMISSVIFQSDKDFKETERFRNTKLYFDTPLLMHILGYSGDSLRQSVMEMARLLQKQGAQLCYFRHNLDELNGILDAYISLYNSSALDTSYNFDYFIEHDIKPEKVLEYKALLEKNLEIEGLTLEETPPFNDYNRNIDWTNFDNYLSQNIKYSDPNKRKNDVESIAAIYRLRRYNVYKSYESCNALFVTTNSSLVYHTKKYFKIEEGKKGIPVIIDDTFLTGLAWLKSEQKSQNLPTLKIIADALASQTLSTDFWTSFLNKVAEYENKNLITSEEAALLKVDIFTKKNVYDVTDGDIDKLTQSSMQEILRRNDFERHKEEIEENNRLKVDNKNKDDQIEALSHDYIRISSEKYLNKKVCHWKLLICLGNAWTVIVCCILAVINVLVNFMTSSDKFVLFGGMLGVIFVMVVLNLIDRVLNSYDKSVQQLFYRKAWNLVSNEIDDNETKFQEQIKDVLLNEIKEFSENKDSITCQCKI